MVRICSFAAAALATCAALAAQANYTTYGSGCGSYGGATQPAVLWCTDTPKIGTTAYVHFLGPSYVPGWNWSQIFPTLLTGFSRTSVGGVSLPFHVNFGPVGGSNCMLWCSAEFSVQTRSILNLDRGAVGVPIPDNTALVGVTIYHQWLLQYHLGWSGGIEGFYILSNGGAMTIGQ